MDTIEDNKQRLQNLIDFSQRRREWYQDLKIKIADRQSDQISLIASISAAILAITSTLSNTRTFWIELSFWSLMAAVVLGVLLLLLLAIFDSSVVTDDRKMELEALDNLKDSTKRAINEYPEYQSKHISDFNKEIERIISLPFKDDWKKKLLSILYYSVLIFFLFGIIGLSLAWIEKGGVVINMNLVVFITILFASISLGWIWYSSIIQDQTSDGKEKLLKDSSKYRKFKDFWAYFINFLIGSSIGYYLVVVRWNYIKSGDSLNGGDYFLMLIFIVSMFGHLPVLSHNITKGVEAILERVLVRK